MTLLPALALVPLLQLLTAQPGGNLPPELRGKGSAAPYDPVLPEAARPIVEKASQAELDPKRGTGNAVEILNAAAKGAEPTLAQALELRKMATVVRARFAANPKVDKATALQQALSTFSKLDVTDPGLSAWLARAMAEVPEAQKKLDPKSEARKIPVAVMVRGAALTRELALETFNKAIAQAGFKLTAAPAKTAAFVLKLAVEEAPPPAGAPADGGVAVRVLLAVERTKDGAVEWATELYRTSKAPSAEVAMRASLEWIARIGSRDLLFRWLTENGLPNALVSLPASKDPHAGHGHGPGAHVGRDEHQPAPAPGTGRVKLPKGMTAEPPPPGASPGKRPN